VLLAGTFDDPSAFTPGMELFLSSAQPWLQAPSERQRFDKIAGLIDGPARGLRANVGICLDETAEHAGTVRVLHTRQPFVVAMAGAGEFDPWKD